jgi:hypothetical protein
MWWTVALLAVLVAGGAAWWRLAWERWRRALADERFARTRDALIRDAEAAELRRARDDLVHATGVAIEEHGRGTALADELHLLLWMDEMEDRP